jgi:hypothetical protein
MVSKSAARGWTVVIAAGASLWLACEPARRVITVPDEMRRRGKVAEPTTPRTYTTASAPAAQPGSVAAAMASSRSSSAAPAPTGNGTVRLAENGRVWEVDLPESSGGYEVRIPLATGVEMPSNADRELMGESAGQTAGAAGNTVSAKAVDPKAQSMKRSYLGGLAKVSELYRSKRFELALIELVDLEHAFPDDARIQAMKGSLYVKLKRIPQAREAYEKSLAINPDDIGVAEALREISEGN